MPAPIITNPYTNDTPLSAYVGEPFRAKIAIANMPVTPKPRLNVTGNWVRWGYRWLAAENSVELLITPTRLLKELIITDEETGTVLETSGIRLEAINTDGSDLAMIPFEFIHRKPIIDDIPVKEFRRGQKGVDYTIRIQHNPNVIAVLGDLLGLDHESGGEGVRIFGDIVDGDLTKPSGTYTVDAANGTGAAPQKIGKWGIPGLPYQPIIVASTPQDRALRIQWGEILSYPDLTETQIRIATSRNGLSSARWTKLSSANARQHTYTQLDNGRTYYVQVRGRNARGYGRISEAISATPQAVPAIPATPESVSVAARNTALIVSWDIPYVFPAITRQEIRYSETQAGLTSATWTDIKSTTAKTHTITGLDNGKTYYVQVRFVNTEGDGTPSTAVSGVPNPIPAIPSAASGVTLTARHKSIVAKWTLPAAFPALSKQQIRWATSQAGLNSATWKDIAADATTHTIDALVNGTTYYVQVRGINTQGDGTASAIVSAIPLGIPDAHTDVSAQGKDKSLTVEWTIGHAYPKLLRQEIRWATSQAGLTSATWTDIKSITATSYTITGLTNKTPYFAQVRGVNAEGDGTLSAIVSATPFEKPTAVIDLTPDISVAGQLTLKWKPSANAVSAGVTHYQYKRSTETKWNDLAAGVLTVTIENLLASSYTYEVRAVVPLGTGDIASVTAEVASGGPGPPVIYRVNAAFGNNVVFRWNAPDATKDGGGYTIQKYQYKLSHQDTWQDHTSLTSLFAFLPTNKGQTFQIRAVGDYGGGDIREGSIASHKWTGERYDAN